MNELKDIENKMDELATKIIPSGWDLKRFIELPLKEKVLGIKFFATMGKDEKIIKMCEYAEKRI